jgi:hypothetical protein
MFTWPLNGCDNKNKIFFWLYLVLGPVETERLRSEDFGEPDDSVFEYNFLEPL